MDAARYAEIQRVYEAIADAAPHERSARLDAACGDDADLRREVESLLAMDDPSSRHADVLSENEIARQRRALEQLRDGVATGTPERIGRYRIVRRIGAGGMGVVYEAEQSAPRRRVALKLVPAHRSTPERLRRFRQEAEILGRLRHPGIAQIHEAGTFDLGEGAQPFFAMEFIDGVDVRTHADRADLDARARLALVAEIADAVEHAHEKGVIHRDLKPENVFVDEHGRPKVLDFGVARASETSTAISTVVTLDGQVIGTLAYMAPEQLSADPDRVTPRADVYALGVLAFELLTGRLPHDLAGLPTTAAIAMLTESDAPRLGRLDTALRGDVETIIGTALEKDPARRYASAAALAADIRRHLDDRPILARPPSGWYRARKFARRHRALVGGTAATIATLLVGVIVAVVLARGQLQERRRADARTLEARRNEARSVGALLRAAEASLEAGRPWEALARHEDVPASSRDWAWRLLDRAVPRQFDLEQRGGEWRVVDRDRFVSRPLQGAGWLLFDARDDSVRSVLAGAGVDRLGRATASGLVRGWAGDDAVLVDLDQGVVRRRWPALHVHEAVSDDERTVLRRTTAERAEVVVDGAVVRALEDLDADVALKLSWDGRSVMRLADDRVTIETAETGTRLLDRAVARRSGSFIDGGAFIVDADDAYVRVDLSGADPVVGGVDLVPGRSSFLRSPRDGRFVVASGHGSARVVDGRSGEPWRGSRLVDETGRMPYSHDEWGTVEVVPDGSRLVVSSRYAPPWIVELDPRAAEPGFDPRCLELRGHASWVYHVAVSHDGSLVASAGPQDPLVRIWDARTGETVGTLGRRTDLTRSWDALMAFSPDDERLVLTTPYGEHPTAIVDWHLADGRIDVEPFEMAGNHLSALDAVIERLDPAPHTRLSQRAAMLDGGAVALWTPAHQNLPIPEDSRSAHGARWRTAFDEDATRGRSTGLAVHPVEPRLAIVSPEPSSVRVGVGRARTGALAVLDVETGEPVHRRPLAVRPWCAAYSPDGALLAIGADDGSVVLFETEFHTLRARWQAHAVGGNRYVHSIAWLPEGERLVTASGDGTLRIWDARRTAEIERDRAAWTALRASMADRSDLDAAYDDLRGDERSAARIERMLHRAAARGAPEGERRAASSE